LRLGYVSQMKRLALLLAITACKTGSTPHAAGDEIVAPAPETLAEIDAYRPDYGADALERALTAERGAEASAEVRLRDLEARGDYDKLRTAIADLAVRRRFIASLEACQATGQVCPP